MSPKSKVQRPGSKRSPNAYLLTEALVYLGLVVIILGLGYGAVYRCIDQSLILRRTTDDITRALDAGERWRSDVRQAREAIRSEVTGTNQVIRLASPQGEIAYERSGDTVKRRVGSGPWISVLSNVKSSNMEPDARHNVTAWSWEVELSPRTKGALKAGRVRPLFTFLAVPQGVASP